jgi:arylsulfatase A
MIPYQEITRREYLKLLAVGSGSLFIPGTVFHACKAVRRELPSIVYIIADDMGYGDVSCLNPEGKIHTPNLDTLAEQGMIFTDAHSGSAVCTPTRYGIITGRYSWRSRLKEGVLWGYSPPLIESERMTVASLLKKQGYATACFGKWHLGLDYTLIDGRLISEKGTDEQIEVDYSKPIKGGPYDLGFDYFFGIPASLDMIPYIYIENDRTVEAPTASTKGATGYEFYREGPIAPGFKHEEVLPKCTQKVVNFINEQSKKNPQKHLFIYFPLNAPHTPILPTDEFEGKSGIGVYGDFVQQCDWVVGQVMQALEQNGKTNNTLFIFTSDNGCSPMADFKDLAEKGHHPSYYFRGHKADIYEGGHRIPFIARWPGRIKAGSRCDDTICLTDLMATVADIVGTQLPDNAGEDSFSILPDLFGTASRPVREATVHHSVNGSFSIRQGKWKLELCPGSGGWSYPTPEKAVSLGLPMIQLYDLRRDLGEQKNLQNRYPDVIYRLTHLLEFYVKNGRSTPGLPQKNEGDPDIWKPMHKHGEKIVE